MKVTLIDYTGAGRKDQNTHAMDVLIFTKNTRLNMSPGLFEEIRSKSYDEKINILKEMANTIPSSWEFVDYTFLVEGATRAFTHQIVRTRHGSYAQQTLRVLDVSEGPGWDYLTGPSIKALPDCDQLIYTIAMGVIAHAYKALVESGAKTEDARGILPTNILTNIVIKYNLRTIVELFQKRESSRVQPEYRETFLPLLKAEILSVHPWVTIFLDRDFDIAARELDEAIQNLEIASSKKLRLTKLLDILRTR